VLSFLSAQHQISELRIAVLNGAIVVKLVVLTFHTQTGPNNHLPASEMVLLAILTHLAITTAPPSAIPHLGQLA
jgi:hypothetical protein